MEPYPSDPDPIILRVTFVLPPWLLHPSQLCYLPQGGIFGIAVLQVSPTPANPRIMSLHIPEG